MTNSESVDETEFLPPGMPPSQNAPHPTPWALSEPHTHQSSEAIPQEATRRVTGLAALEAAYLFIDGGCLHSNDVLPISNECPKSVTVTKCTCVYPSATKLRV